MAQREHLNNQEWAIRFERERKDRERTRRAEHERHLEAAGELLERGEVDPRSAKLERLRRALESRGGEP